MYWHVYVFVAMIIIIIIIVMRQTFYLILMTFNCCWRRGGIILQFELLTFRVGVSLFVNANMSSMSVVVVVVVAFIAAPSSSPLGRCICLVVVKVARRKPRRQLLRFADVIRTKCIGCLWCLQASSVGLPGSSPSQCDKPVRRNAHAYLLLLPGRRRQTWLLCLERQHQQCR